MRNNKMHSRIPMLIFSALFVIIVFCDTLSKISILTDKEETTATVTNVVTTRTYSARRHRSRTKYHVSITYDVDGEKCNSSFTSSSNRYFRGDSVDIIYKKSNPSRMLIKSSFATKLIFEWATAIILVIMSIVSFKKVGGYGSKYSSFSKSFSGLGVNENYSQNDNQGPGNTQYGNYNGYNNDQYSSSGYNSSQYNNDGYSNSGYNNTQYNNSGYQSANDQWENFKNNYNNNEANIYTNYDDYNPDNRYNRK